MSSSTYYPIDNQLLSRYEVDEDAIRELLDSSLMEEIEHMLYGDCGCIEVRHVKWRDLRSTS